MTRVIQNYLYNLGYQAITLILPFLIIPYLTRVLGPGNLGIEAYTMSIISIVTTFATAGTNLYAIRLVASLRDNIFELKKAIYTLLFFRIIFGSTVILAFFIFTMNSQYKTFLLLQGIYLVSSTLLDCTWYFSGKERFKDLTVRNLVIKFVGFLLTIIFVKDASDLNIYIIINGITLLLPNLYFVFILVKEMGLPELKYFNINNFKTIFIEILPFFLIALTIQIYMNFDRLVIEHYGLTYELGIYNQILKAITVFLAPITALGTILMPYISNLKMSKEKSNIEQTIFISTNAIFLIGIPMFFGLIIISEQFVHYYFGNEFSNYTNVFRMGCILILTGCINNIVINQVILPNLHEKIYIKGLVIATLIRFLVIQLLINKYGVVTAIIGYILGEVFLLSWCTMKVKKINNLVPMLFNLNNLKIIGAGFIMFLILSFLKSNMVIDILLGIIIYLTSLVILQENMMKKLFLILKKKTIL
ncbi:oligosaccharide flippase family protein [Fictibacillus enclensis]|uniref:oligosaccharide flippase family protein n=1 Tax=Fictibacillus enclensis TaxID=1017270 RepID=UPI0025A0EFA0|nr:oligosaccharide flippase family protein [Fictibacillus enclensis]MDM5340541.1 oligosaccharide flippase family protein [Fictibacillus enclensis]